MVPLPLFKLASLFVRHISKYGANHIKARAHDHPRFRSFAARYGQSMHQLNMRMSVALLRDPEAERRAKEKAEAPTVRTQEQQKQHDEKERRAEEQHKRAEEGKGQHKGMAGEAKAKPIPLQSVWRRKFRPLPEAKAVDLFADVVGDAFILAVACGLIVYEYWKALQKPDINKERIDELTRRCDELTKRDDELAAAEEEQKKRFESLEDALKALQGSNTKRTFLSSAQRS